MTKTGKCDVCRFRKIRCDERKPSCGGCLRSARECTYTFTDSFRHVHRPSGGATSDAQTSTPSANVRDRPGGLDVRSSRRAPSGHGSYHTLSLKRGVATVPQAATSSLTDVIHAPLTGELTRLASRWIYMIGPLQQKVPLSYGNAGIFQRVPARLGSDGVLDAAVRYTLDSHRAFVTQDEPLAALARRSGIAAMRSLRSRIANVANGQDDAVALSMVLLVTAEYYHDVQAYLFQAHALALTRILKSRWTSGKWGELEQTLLQSIWLEEVEDCVFSGSESEFDDAARLEAKTNAGLKTENEIILAFDYTIEQMIRIPRLLRYFREYASRANEQNLAWDIGTLVTSIYDEGGQEHFEELIRSQSCVVPATDGPFANPLGNALEFPSMQVFTMTAFYYTYRIIICGILQRLLDYDLPEVACRYSRSRIEEEDERAAEQIAMCVEYALSDANCGPSHKAIRMHDPLVMAWGSWDRLEKRAVASEGEDGVTAQRAAQMKTFCKNNLHRVMRLWHAPKLLEIVEATSDAFTGGPTMPYMARRGDWRRLLAVDEVLVT